MEIANEIQKHEGWVAGGVKSHFNAPSELVNLLEPLVLALGWRGSYRQLIEALPHFSEDLSLTDFLNVMVEINYNNEKSCMSLDAIPEKFMPCIFVPNDGAVLLILEQNDMGFKVIDGETGKQEHIAPTNVKGTIYRFSQFDVDKAIVTKRTESFSEIIIRFRPLIIQIFILTLIYNIFIAMVPLYIMLVYDRIIPSESITMSATFLIGILIFLYSAQLLAVARIKIVAYIGARMDKTIGESIIRHLLYLAPTYTESNTVGVQIARIKSFDNIRDFFTSSIAIMACEFPFAIVFLALIFAIGGWLGFVPIILAIIFYVIYRLANPLVTRYIKAQSAQSMLKQTFLLETFVRARDIKETGRSGVWDEKFSLMLINLSQSGFDNAYYNTVLSIISEEFMQMAALAMLVFGAIMSIDDTMTLGALIAVMMLTWKVLNPMKTFFCITTKSGTNFC